MEDASDSEFPNHDGEVKRQGVDDWTPSQVVLWLRKQGITPWNQELFANRVEDFGLNGELLLSHRAADTLSVLDPDTDFTSPVTQDNVFRLQRGLDALLQTIKEDPVDFWEFRVAHRRSAALVQSGLSLAPRATVIYMLMHEREALFLIVGPEGLSLLSFLLLLLTPHLAVALHIWHVTPHAPALAWTLLASHLLSSLAAILNARASGSIWKAFFGAVRFDLVALGCLYALRLALHMVAWWVVDIVLFVALLLQVVLALYSSVVCRDRVHAIASALISPPRRRYYRPMVATGKSKTRAKRA